MKNLEELDEETVLEKSKILKEFNERRKQEESTKTDYTYQKKQGKQNYLIIIYMCTIN